MQRTQNDGIIISCDFCGQDWDEVLPMIEGHHGSVLCLSCLQKALEQKAPAPQGFDCTLCLQHQDAGVIAWTPAERSSAANPVAAACESCLKQAAGTFSKDPDVDWKWDRRK